MLSKKTQSDASDPKCSETDRFILVAEILGAHGVGGHIKVLPYAQQAHEQSTLVHAKYWRIVREAPGTPGLESALESRTIQVLEIRPHNRDTFVAQIQGEMQREEAQALKGWKIYVCRTVFPKLNQDEYYWVDLIGLSAVNRKGVVLGTVSGLLENGAHAILRIAPPVDAQGIEEKNDAPCQQHGAGRKAVKKQKPPSEILIPFVKAYVGDVCFTTRTIEIDWDGEEDEA